MENFKQYAEDFFNKINKDTIDQVSEFYSSDAQFIDPISRADGIESIKKHFAKVYQNVKSIRFQFDSSVDTGNDHCIYWRMYFQAGGLNGGKEITVNGHSHLRTNSEGKVEFHRDYFDMGEMVYEQLPLLGTLISKVIKARLG